MENEAQLAFREALMVAVTECECSLEEVLFELMMATVSNAIFHKAWSSDELKQNLSKMIEVVKEVEVLRENNPFASADTEPAEA
jgi:hypothetical protein